MLEHKIYMILIDNNIVTVNILFRKFLDIKPSHFPNKKKYILEYIKITLHINIQLKTSSITQDWKSQ